jgi:hypothetical protein
MKKLGLLEAVTWQLMPFSIKPNTESVSNSKVIIMTISRVMRRAGYIAGMGEIRHVHKIWTGCFGLEVMI